MIDDLFTFLHFIYIYYYISPRFAPLVADWWMLISQKCPQNTLI